MQQEGTVEHRIAIMRHRLLSSLPFLLLLLRLHATSLPLETTDFSTMTSGWESARKNLAITGKSLCIGGGEFARGIGTHAPSEFITQLDGKATTFTAQVGIDDAATKPGAASLEVLVIGDGRDLWKSGLCKQGEPARRES